MGIFSSMFSGKSKEDDQAANKIPSLPISAGLRVSVSTPDGKPLLSGRISEFNETSLKLERSPGQISFTVLERGTKVLVRGFAGAGAPFDLTGTVKESTRIMCSIDGVRRIVHKEHRSSFRMPISIPISAYYQDDTRLQNAEPCTLVDLSVGGACFQSEYIHGEGEVLRLKIQIDDYTPMVFLGEVLRVEETTPGHFRYGFLFAQLEEKDASALAKMLYNLQVGSRKEWSRSRDDGHWY